MRTFGLLFLFAFLLASQSREKERLVPQTYTVDGEKISFNVKTFSPPFVIKMDEKMLNQSTPLNCSYLFYSYLAKADLEAASRLSNDPEKTKTKYERHKERVGEAAFKKMMGDIFSGKAQLKYQLSVGDAVMLVIHDSEDDDLLAQMYVKDKANYVYAERSTKDVDQLGKLFNAIQEEKLKLK